MDKELWYIHIVEFRHKKNESLSFMATGTGGGHYGE
jgi:hypothetical protein